MAANTVKKTIYFLILACSSVAVFYAGIFFERSDMPLVHKLKFPLMLDGGEGQHDYLLPAGTSLYYDQAFSEGFVRYKIYVNVEGVLLESKEATEKFWLSPLTAFPVDKGQLKKLLKEYPLSKAELSEILKSNQITKEEIRELLAEYSQ